VVVVVSKTEKAEILRGARQRGRSVSEIGRLALLAASGSAPESEDRDES
jgi:hypothetical protein